MWKLNLAKRNSHTTYVWARALGHVLWTPQWAPPTESLPRAASPPGNAAACSAASGGGIGCARAWFSESQSCAHPTVSQFRKTQNLILFILQIGQWFSYTDSFMYKFSYGLINSWETFVKNHVYSIQVQMYIITATVSLHILWYNINMLHTCIIFNIITLNH